MGKREVARVVYTASCSFISGFPASKSQAAFLCHVLLP